MNKLFSVLLGTNLLFSPLSSIASPLDDEAANIALQTIGIQNNIVCKIGSTEVIQWAIIPPNDSPLPTTYLEAVNLSKYRIQSIQPINPHVSWYGVITWDAQWHRTFSKATGLIESTQNPFLRVVLQKHDGQWQILDGVNTPLSQPPHCIDFDAEERDRKQAHQQQTDDLIRHQREQFRQNQQRYPVEPHTRDPYYHPNGVR